jgi:hypothetical protein
MKKLLLAFSLVAFVSLTGCTSLIMSAALNSSGIQLSDAQLNAYVVRHATQAEIMAEIGNPEGRIQLKNGELFEYGYVTNKGVGKMPDNGKVVFEFDADNRVIKQYRVLQPLN